MPSLRVLKGANPGQALDLGKDPFKIGRDPGCNLVLAGSAVSREHAQIVWQNNQYFLKDNKSRNKTFLNNQEVDPEVLVRLHDNDRIRICDFMCEFKEKETVEKVGGDKDEDDRDSTIMSTVEAGSSSHLILESQPKEKLRILLEITNNLTKTLELEPLLPQIIDSLFQIFKQADRGFIIVRDETTRKLIPKAIKARREKDEGSARFSRSIVNQCIDSGLAVLSEDALSDDRFSMSQSISDFRIRSVMCAPLRAGDGHTFGVIQLDTQDRSKKFTQEDLQLLVAVSNQAAVALENAKMHEDMMSLAKMQREMQFAKDVSKGFLPANLPVVAGYEFFAFYKAANAIGGDFYGFLELPTQCLAIAMGDVAGKGVPAALLMARLSAEFRYCVLSEADPAAAISKLNDLLQQAGLADRFVTFALIVLDPKNHKMLVVNAGHLPPIIRRAATNTIEEVAGGDQGGYPLGVFDHYEYKSVEAQLNPGDAVFVCTDGVPDSMNANEEAFSQEKVNGTIQSGPSTPAALGKNMLKIVEAHSAGRTIQFDDMTLLCFGRV